MDGTLQLAAPYAPLVLALLLLVLLAPAARPSNRRAIGLTLALTGTGLAMFAIFQGGDARELEIVNPFLRGETREPFAYVTDRVTAPAWAWPLAMSIGFLGPAFALLFWRDRAMPSPMVLGGAVGLWVLALRLGLEKSAAPAGAVWATSVTVSLFVILPFVGGYAGATGASFLGFVRSVLGVGLIHRLGITAVGFVVTVFGLGTHLDVSAVDDLNPPMFGAFLLSESRVERWAVAILMLQLTFWVVFTLVAGIVLGTVPFCIARRRRLARGDLVAAESRPPGYPGG